MKTNVAITSIRSYHALRESGFKGQHAAILSHMEPDAIYSRRQLANMTGIETSAVAGRINELVDRGVVEQCGLMRCPVTGRTVSAVKVVCNQMELMA